MEGDKDKFFEKRTPFQKAYPKREKDRERAQARKPQSKGKDDGLTPEQRRERDAKALQEKAAKKATAAGSGEGGGNKNNGKK